MPDTIRVVQSASGANWWDRIARSVATGRRCGRRALRELGLDGTDRQSSPDWEDREPVTSSTKTVQSLPILRMPLRYGDHRQGQQGAVDPPRSAKSVHMTTGKLGVELTALQTTAHAPCGGPATPANLNAPIEEALMLSIEDKLAIHDLISLYGHIVDNREFSRTHELFTDDAVYDISDFNAGVHIGWPAVARLWRDLEGQHPIAHHATNVLVSQDDDGTVRVLSKAIGILGDLSAGSAIYKDIVVKTPAGWRMSHRVAIPRSPNRIPPHT